MMKEDYRIFERTLRKIEKPALETLGFKFDQRRTFRKTLVDGTSWEVRFQWGVRFMQGEFTVNLAHYRPGESSPHQERIGAVRDTRWVRILAWLFPDPRSIWRTLLGPRDKWWRLSASEAEAERTHRKIVSIIECDAIQWFLSKGGTP